MPSTTRTIRVLTSTGLKPGSLRAPWRERSACSKAIEKEPQLANAFTDDSRVGYFTVKRICRTCVVKVDCLMDALADPHSEGFRAMFFFMNGALSAQDNRILQETYGVRAKPKQKKREPKCVDQNL